MTLTPPYTSLTKQKLRKINYINNLLNVVLQRRLTPDNIFTR